MSSRPGSVTKVERPAYGGEPPNQYRAAVTVEIRVFWPPLASDDEIEEALQEATVLACEHIAARRAEGAKGQE